MTNTSITDSLILSDWKKAWKNQAVVISAYEDRIKELEEEVIHWKSNHDNQVKLKSQLMDRPDLKDRAASIEKLNARIQELEAWNEMLRETGHWIGQDEAYDLKVAVQKFLDMTRLGRILDEETTVWEVPCWQMRELKEALNKCGSFKSYSLTPPPKHKEPPHNHPTQIPPQEFESPQTEPNL